MSRYGTTSIIKDADGKQRRGTTILPVIPISSNDTYIVTTTPERLDKLADTFYNDVSLWWVIAAANGVGKGTFIIPANRPLRIPALSNFNDAIAEINRNR